MNFSKYQRSFNSTCRGIRRLFKRNNTKLSIDLALDKDFIKSIHRLEDKYGYEFELMNGFSNSNLNFSDFIDNFIDAKTVADVSIDANANSNTHDICTLVNDMMKPHSKLLCFNKIFYEMKRFYGLDLANKWLEDEWVGALYLHDASTASFKPYCFAYDLDKIAEKGLFFINKFKTGAPQHLTTFNDHVLEFVSWACNRSSGAVGMPSYLVYSWYFWNKDVQNGFYLKDPEYYRRQYFQKFVYDLNQPYLRITEASFTNISIMDRCYLKELFGGREFPDGTFAIDHIEEILEHQKVFMEVVAETRSKTMATFPVLTYSLLYQNDKFVDEEFARWCNKHNMQWYDSNFYVGSDVTSLSNCCFDARQQMIIKVDDKTYEGPFKILYQAFHRYNNISVYYDGEWKPAKLVTLKEKHPIYKITTRSERVVYSTDDHIHLTISDINGEPTVEEVKTYNLKVGQNFKIAPNPITPNLQYLEIATTEDTKYAKSNQYYTDQIVNIERVDQDGDYVFCVEMEDKDHPYFTLGNGVQTHNCRLISDTSKLDAFINSIGGTSLSIGSVKVSTINLRRIALECNHDEDRFMEILQDRVNTDVAVLDCVRHIIQRNVEKGLLPNYTYGLIDMEKQYNTIGITAMFEALNEFPDYITKDSLGNLYYSDKGMQFAKRIMKAINSQKESYDFKYSINIECVPAERANVVLCKKDTVLYPNAEEYFIYSNQWIPLMEKCTIQEKIRLGAALDKECGGGQISHVSLESKFSTEEQSWNMLNYIAKSGVIYFAYNTKISVCKNEHAFYGDICPHCGEPVADIFERVVGFLTPHSSWSKERRREGKKRVRFDPNEWLKIYDDMGMNK